MILQRVFVEIGMATATTTSSTTPSPSMLNTTKSMMNTALNLPSLTTPVMTLSTRTAMLKLRNCAVLLRLHLSPNVTLQYRLELERKVHWQTASLMCVTVGWNKTVPATHLMHMPRLALNRVLTFESGGMRWTTAPMSVLSHKST